MPFQIIGNADRDRIYCAGSFTKLLTTFVSLSLLSEQYAIYAILDDENFFDTLCQEPEAKAFLQLFQRLVGKPFSLHDVCSFYLGLPYTFNLAKDELQQVESGQPFKHHCIPDEKTLLARCHENIVPVYPPHAKFHYSEIGIIFLGYLLEKVYNIEIESLYQRFLIEKFQLKNSRFSRKRVPLVHIHDYSDKYDYPSIAILDHGYFCYSNGFYTTLNDMKTMLDALLQEPVFKIMTDIKIARAASNRLLNGLTVEMRLQGSDIVYGYEGLSFSGCNIWAYSTERQTGYLTLCDSEEEAYTLIYNEQLGYPDSDKVPDDTQVLYKNFLQEPHAPIEMKAIPEAYQGQYHRVNINESTLTDIFTVGDHFIVIRNPDTVRYEIAYANGHYAVLGADKLTGIIVDFYEAPSGNRYMLFDGTLYERNASPAI
jgi:hypothetical protein